MIARPYRAKWVDAEVTVRWWPWILVLGCQADKECGEGELENAYGDCVPFDGVADEPFEANNHGLLSGAVFPEGGVHDPALVKTLTYTIDGWSNVELGTLTASRGSADSSYVRLVLEVTNQGPSLCFLQLDDLAMFDGSGTFLEDEEITYVQGSVFDLDVVHTDTCLGSGEQGWFLVIAEADFDLLEHVEATADTPDKEGALDDARVIPTGYTVSGNDITIEAVHEAGPTVESDFGGRFVVLDDGGSPVYWDFVDLEGTTIEPGATVTFVGTASGVDVAGSTIDVRLDFEPVGSDRAATEAGAARRWRERNLRQAELEGIVRSGP